MCMATYVIGLGLALPATHTLAHTYLAVSRRDKFAKHMQ